MSIEKSVVVIGPIFGAFSSVCEVLDSHTGPEYKLFRFRDCCKWHAKTNPLKQINIFSHWSEESVGNCEGRYRVTKKLDTPDGFIAAYEGTTAAHEARDAAPKFDPDSAKCEAAILDAMIAEARMTVYALKRKTHADRFGKDLWETCLQTLVDAGEIRLETTRGLTKKERIWVNRCDEDTAPAHQALAPSN